MGLKVHSLAQLPAEAGSRDYYLYLLDYGWEEPLGRALRDNFDRMAEMASRNGAAVIAGLGHEFNDEVLAWHGINGSKAENILPAILLTNRRPSKFESQGHTHGEPWNPAEDFLVVLPLRERCKTATDVAALIDEVFRDIKAGARLSNFTVARQDRAGQSGAVLDAVILQPSIGGIGVDLRKLWSGLRGDPKAGA